MKKNLSWLLGIGGLLIIGIAYFLYSDNDGRLYSSKYSLCMDFAQSYLRTIPKIEKDFNDEKWRMAVAVETELYNMCLLDLKEEALGSFQARALEEYSK